MKAWPAADESQTDGAIDAVIGVTALVAALALGGTPLWLLPLVVVLGALAVVTIRRAPRELELVYPAPPEFVVHGRAMVIARQALEPLLFAALVVVLVAPGAPEFLGVFGVASLFGAATSLARARAIARWQLEHGGRVLRTRGDLWVAH